MTFLELCAAALLLTAATLAAAAETLLLALDRDLAGVLGPARREGGALAGLARRAETSLIGVQVFELAVEFSLALLVAAAMARTGSAWGTAGAVVAVALAALALAEFARGRLLASLEHSLARGQTATVGAGARALATLATALSPLGRVVRLGVGALVAPVSRAARYGSRRSRISSDEVNRLLEEASRHGALLHGESHVLLNLVRFGTETVTAYMTPRTEVDGLDVSWDAERILETIRRTRHRRFPVVEGSLDQVFGCVVAKEYCLDAGRGLEGHLRPLPYVPETKIVGELFQEMRAAGNHMALVVDEYGGVIGMVTLNGLVSRLMGEIPDEFTGDPVRILQLEARRYLVDGAVSVERLNEELRLALPLKPNTTVGGLVFSLIGHVPPAGASVQSGGVTFRVLELRHNRIVSLEVETP